MCSSFDENHQSNHNETVGGVLEGLSRYEHIPQEVRLEACEVLPGGHAVKEVMPWGQM